MNYSVFPLRLNLLFFVAGILHLLLPAHGQLRIGTGTARKLYKQHCAVCHGEQMQGGLGSSLVDGEWKYGSTDEAISRVIREGLEDFDMTAFGDVLSEQEIRSLVILIREQAQLAKVEAMSEAGPSEGGSWSSKYHDFRLEPIAERNGILWSLDFMPDGRMLVTEKSGKLWILENREWVGPVRGTPTVWDRGQGGLLEVALHPEYGKNGWVYLAYSEKSNPSHLAKPGGMTTVVRGRIKGNRWVDQEVIFRVPPKYHTSRGVHFGTRFVFEDGYLFFSIGDRGRKEMAQDIKLPNGKVHRIHDDGRIPSDNPFAGESGAYESIWTYGNRNPQGLAMHPVTGELWESEHGPRGGDEINRLEKGSNYGWPEITYGMNYDGTPITNKTKEAGMEQPVHYWTPSIAVCGIDFYRGDRFPEWKNHLFAGGLASEELHRLKIAGDRVVEKEILFKNQGRVRHVINGPDGYLYVLLEHSSTKRGSIARLMPVE